MKKMPFVVLFASIFVIGAVAVNMITPSSLMMAPTHQSQEPFGMLGHVEFVLQNSDGDIVEYRQGDNIVVNGGEDCVSEYVFGTGTCALSTNFNYIGIGNHSSGTVSETNSTLADANDNVTGVCAISGTNGEMARKQVVATSTPASGSTGTIVVLDTASSPFTFDSSNASLIFDSGVFNGNYDTPGSDALCPGGSTQTSGLHWEMFSRQLLNGAIGVNATDGDSLSVKWTITVG